MSKEEAKECAECFAQENPAKNNFLWNGHNGVRYNYCSMVCFDAWIKKHGKYQQNSLYTYNDTLTAAIV
jgi:hypothetical protein